MKRPYLLLIPILVIAVAFVWRRANNETFSLIPEPELMQNPEVPAPLIAAISEVNGAASMSRGGLPLEGPRVGQTLQAGDVIATSEDGRVAIEFFSGARTALDANTTVRVIEASIDANEWKKSRVALDVERGRTWSRVLVLHDIAAFYTLTSGTEPAVTSLRSGAFLTTVNSSKPARPSFHQFDGTLVFTGKTENRLNPGFSLAFTSAAPLDGVMTFTEDDIRNDAWVREQLKADQDFANRAGQIRGQRGIAEDLSKIGLEIGPLESEAKTGTVKIVIAPRINGQNTVKPGDTLDLKATAITIENGKTTEEEVTAKVKWQVSDLSLANSDPFGAVTANLSAAGKLTVVARYNYGSKEVSASYPVTIAGKPIVDLKTP